MGLFDASRSGIRLWALSSLAPVRTQPGGGRRRVQACGPEDSPARPAGVCSAMTILDQSTRWGEIRDTLKLAWPMALTQLGQIAMLTTDVAMIGRLGEKALGAAALAHAILFAAFVLGMGLVSAVAPLAAQAYGRGDDEGVRAALRVGLWATLLVGAPLTAVQFWGYELLVLAGQAPDTAVLAARYLHGLAWSVAPGWAFIALRGFMGAVNRPQPALWIMVAAVPANALLAYGLIYGAFGLPNLDMLGAGVATTIVNILMLIACFYVAYTQEPFRKYRILSGFWRWDWPLLRRLLWIGAPISAAFFIEYGLFSAASLIMGAIGAAELAAHQVALQTATILFMGPFGLSMAATVRVGHAIGRGDLQAARRAGFSAFVIGFVFMLGMTAVIASARHVIPHAFLGGQTSPETIALAASLLLVGTSFFVFDGVQTVAAGALRGMSDTRVPLLFSAFSFWCVGFAAAYGLGIWAGFGGPGVWLGLTLGLMTFSILLVWRFERLTRG